jgi:hypothetical protein
MKQFNQEDPQEQFYLYHKGVLGERLTWDPIRMVYAYDSGEPINCFHGSLGECVSLMPDETFEQYLQMVEEYK